MDLVNRLKFFLEENKIAISQFADKCRIPRPTLSQILNGRNKKISDELITKIHEAYPNLSVLWLMFGEGHMLMSANMRFSGPLHKDFFQSDEAQSTETNEIAESKAQDSTLTENYSEKNSESEKAILEQNRQSDSKFSVAHDVNSRLAQPNSNTPGNEWVNVGLSSEGNNIRVASTTNPIELAQSNGELNFSDGYDQPSDFNNDESKFNEGNSYNNRPGTQQEQYRQSEQGERQRNGGEYGSIEFLSAINEEPNQEDKKSEERPNESNGTSSERNRGTTLSVPTLAGKKITNIVVFYSDNSFQSFLPSAI